MYRHGTKLTRFVSWIKSNSQIFTFTGVQATSFACLIKETRVYVKGASYHLHYMLHDLFIIL